MKTAAQKYSESNAEAILAYFRGVDGTFVPTPVPPLEPSERGVERMTDQLFMHNPDFRRFDSLAVDELIRLDESRTDEKLLQAIAAADADADARDEGDTRDEESLEDHNIQGLGAYRDVFDADGEQ
jgi:hypothetical protein